MTTRISKGSSTEDLNFYSWRDLRFVLAVDETATSLDVLHANQDGRMCLDPLSYGDIAAVGDCTNQKRNIHAKGWHEG